jgi:ribosomal protein S18 acetylase RimI-like enzyme
MCTAAHLRRATAADADAIADVFLSSWRFALPSIQLAHTDEEVRAWIREVVVPGSETWIAEVAASAGDGAEIVGMMVLTPDAIDQLYLRPGWSRRGLGSRFMALAKERRPDGISLFTFQINTAARAFYERHGFVAVEFNDGQRNEEHAPDVRYVWAPAP